MMLTDVKRNFIRPLSNVVYLQSCTNGVGDEQNMPC